MCTEPGLGKVIQHMFWTGRLQWDLHPAVQNTVLCYQVSLITEGCWNEGTKKLTHAAGHVPAVWLMLENSYTKLNVFSWASPWDQSAQLPLLPGGFAQSCTNFVIPQKQCPQTADSLGLTEKLQYLPCRNVYSFNLSVSVHVHWYFQVYECLLMRWRGWFYHFNYFSLSYYVSSVYMTK